MKISPILLIVITLTTSFLSVRVGAQAKTSASYCASINEKAIECGAINGFRPSKCCQGLVCAAGPAQKHCVESSEVPVPATCAAENERAIACGAAVRIGRSQGCCPGYMCAPGNAKVTCTLIENVSLADRMQCAAEGERAQECGASISTRNKAICCDGLVCTPGNAKVTCIAPENIPPPPTCAAENERAVSCGALQLADGSRAERCCGNLICHPGNAKKICVNPATIEAEQQAPQCAIEGERAVECGALAIPGRSNACCGGYVCSPDRAKVVCVSEAGVDPIDVLKQAQTCALEGERAMDCGANVAPGRHQSCCEGYSCDSRSVKVTCIKVAPTCGTEGVKATSCGALPAADRPVSCCEGFTCRPGPQQVSCTSVNNVIQPNSNVDGAVCAVAGEKAQACGATNPGRPIECCHGFLCENGVGFRCVVDPLAPAVSPTKGPTKGPVISPTQRPTNQPLGPTEPSIIAPIANPTKAPTESPIIGPDGSNIAGEDPVDGFDSIEAVNPNETDEASTKSPSPIDGPVDSDPESIPTEEPVLESIFSHAIFTSLKLGDDVLKKEYPKIAQTLMGVSNDILARTTGFDIRTQGTAQGNDNRLRRLVFLDQESISFNPMQKGNDFSWVAFRISYNIEELEGLDKSEIKGRIDKNWKDSIDDGSLLRDLQNKNSKILGVAAYGQEGQNDALPPPPPSSTPWWVWLIVGLVCLAGLVALTLFIVARRSTKRARKRASKKGILMRDDDDEESDKINITATFEESSDEGHQESSPNEAFSHGQTFNATFPKFEIPPGTSALATDAGAEWGESFSMNSLAKAGW